MTTRNHRSIGFARFVATRGSMLLLALVSIAGCRDQSPVEPGLDLTGSWTLRVEGVCQGPMNIVQAGSNFSVTGSVGGALCPFNASGSGNGLLSGREISFGIGFGSGAGPIGTSPGSITFEGSVEPNGNQMSGSFDGDRSGIWEAVRN